MPGSFKIEHDDSYLLDREENFLIDALRRRSECPQECARHGRAFGQEKAGRLASDAVRPARFTAARHISSVRISFGMRVFFLAIRERIVVDDGNDFLAVFGAAR
jgi:hypothetical protein